MAWRRPLALALLLAGVTAAGTSVAAPVTYGFTGTVGPLPVSDPAYLFFGQLVAGVTPVSGSFTIDSAALDGDAANVDRAVYAFSGADAFVVTVGPFTFRSSENGITLTDDRPVLPVPGSDLVDRLAVTSSAIDPVILPAFDYRVHTGIVGLSVQDADEDAVTLLDAIAPVPSLEGFGAAGSSGSLGILGCGLGGLVGGSCTSQLFEIGATIDGVFVIPEPASAALIALGVAGLGALRRAGG